MTDTLPEAKRAMRQQMLAMRRQVQLAFPSADPHGGFRLLAQFQKHFEIKQALIVSGYIARDSEIDPAPLLAWLHGQGHQLVLPVTPSRGEPLIFRSYEPGDMLVAGPMGLREPGPQALDLSPDILLVPLLAFDRRGYRLGYGGGYYDRTLAALASSKPVIGIGVGFAEQEVPTVPKGPFDVPLNAFVTENGVFFIGDTLNPAMIMAKS